MAFKERILELDEVAQGSALSALEEALKEVEGLHGIIRGVLLEDDMSLEWGIKIKVQDRSGRNSFAYSSAGRSGRSYALELLQAHQPNTTRHGMTYGTAVLVCRGVGAWEEVEDD